MFKTKTVFATENALRNRINESSMSVTGHLLEYSHYVNHKILDDLR